LWDEYRLDELFSDIIKPLKIKFDFFSSVFLMVLDRLCEPKSKLKTHQKQEKYHRIKENSLQHLYRALDILADKKEDIEKYLFEANKSLFNTKVDIVFYDVTTLYFESVRKDTIRDFGFSKDLKVNEVQIILGLIIDQETRPIGFDIFSGNTFEGHTIKTLLDKLNKRFQINRLIFIGETK
jgi:transposase